jgi:hypothetical protein
MIHKPASISAVLCALAFFAPSVTSTYAADAETEFFEKKIRPVLVERCYKCHSERAGKKKGGLLLDSREMIRRGGDSGAAVAPGDLDASLLLSAIRYEAYEMPPDGKLADSVIADFSKWIESGAADPRDAPATSLEPAHIDWDKARKFWSFQLPHRWPLPKVASGTTIRDPIDAFVVANLEAAGIEPSPAATRSVLIRRLTVDLTGLPPDAMEITAFVGDKSPWAYERVVDRLLASPRYGERWARMWLDVARYAEDQAHIVGNNSSLCYPNAYLYRDWVINALNTDMPYDTFVRQQLAADLIDPDDPTDHVALGFIGLGPKYYRRSSPEVMAEEWEDRVDTVTRGLLGLTVACARCHDHKFDPIPTSDYYALAGVFASTEMFNRPLDDKRQKGNNGHAKKEADALHIVRDVRPRDLNVFIRGDVKNLGPLAKRGFPRVISGTQQLEFKQGSGRLELADAIVSRDNPLTARVIVNRIWALHFGRPLVATPSNFGKLGQPPTHPKLFDDLAVRFMETGWSLKWLHRTIVLSATYRQSSEITPAQHAIDPSNRLLWRMNRRRLDIESWRDALLAISGQLAGEIGGKSIEPQQPTERRRTVYSRISRLELDPMLAMFDFPDPSAHSAGRNETTTPLQKLFVLNSPFMVMQAKALASRVLAGESNAAGRVRLAYRTVHGRQPIDVELQLGLEFLDGCQQDDEHDRWTQYAHVLLASNELLIVD